MQSAPGRSCRTRASPLDFSLYHPRLPLKILFFYPAAFRFRWLGPWRGRGRPMCLPWCHKGNHPNRNATLSIPNSSELASRRSLSARGGLFRRRPESRNVTRNPCHSWPVFLDTGFRRYDGVGRVGNLLYSESLLLSGSNPSKVVTSPVCQG